MNSREYIVLHHTAIPFLGPQFDRVNEYHKSRGFPTSSLGYYVGYHYFIGVDGTVRAARAEWETGAHDNAMLMNYRGIGICLAGDFSGEARPTEAQLRSLKALLTDVKARNQIPDSRVLLHRETKYTECPGVDYRKLLKELQAHDVEIKLDEYRAEFEKATTTPGRKRVLSRLIERILRHLPGPSL